MKSTQSSARRLRLAVSLAAGAVVAGGLVAWDAGPHHKSLAAAAAVPQPEGGHETVGFILATGGIFTFLVVALVVFAVLTVVARARGRRPAAAPAYAVPARRGRAYARRW